MGLKSGEGNFSLLNNTHLFFGKTVTFHPAYLVWVPFHLPNSEVFQYIKLILKINRIPIL